MATASVTDTDIRVRDAVTHQLDWDPEVDASAIGVAATEGSVTLTGYIDTYAGKLAAERAAKRIRGVRAVANDIEVRLRIERGDADIAKDAAQALALRASIPETIKAVVHHGHMTLTGSASWLFQRREAEKAVRHIRGVRNVTNYVEILSAAGQREVRHHIAEALHRNASIDARRIHVSVRGSTVLLTGTVSSWAQRETAERAAADAPGMARVDNCITVESALEFNHSS